MSLLQAQPEEVPEQGVEELLLAWMAFSPQSEISVYVPIDSITSEQMGLLRSRKKKNGQLSEEAKWVEIYQVLFPHDDHIPPPYKDFCPLSFDDYGQAGEENILVHFEEYARNEFPRRMQPVMEELVDRSLSQSLQPETITELTQTVLSGLLTSFRQINQQSVVQVPVTTSSAEVSLQQGIGDDGMLPDFSNPNIPVDFDVEELLNSLGSGENNDSGYGSWLGGQKQGSQDPESH
ncbi:hypothetical protein FZEAL_2941 [Fusarium zealandicum]|uniref:Uncharacterized protein n=1 Tax=Fusarium zealandicum TaxID=1053134 RepID=A0A8H4XND7_9HYPO|nr:hypothetical protein FZEAL_2941 [Fusarium zealandicum]